jgi:hypothetical protein
MTICFSRPDELTCFSYLVEMVPMQGQMLSLKMSFLYKSCFFEHRRIVHHYVKKNLSMSHLFIKVHACFFHVTLRGFSPMLF